MTHAERRQCLRALAAAGSLSLAPAALRAQATPLLTLAEMTAPLVGSARLRNEGVRLELPALADNGHVVPLRVAVVSPMTADDHVTLIWLLSPRNPVMRMAVFHLGPWSGRAEIATRVRLAGTQAVVALARQSNGVFLYAQSEVIVTESACLDAG
jgi:sulfur-oxidizing protein SoxY